MFNGGYNMKYNVQMLVTGTVTKTVDADSPYKAKEIASEKYGDQSIILCSRCAHVVEGLSISEDPDSYEVELIEEQIEKLFPCERQDENMNKSESPTLDRMIEIREQSQLCGEFLDWFLRKYTVFDRKRKRESPFANVMGNGDYINKEKLLAEFFDIDLVEAEKERQAMLDAM